MMHKTNFSSSRPGRVACLLVSWLLLSNGPVLATNTEQRPMNLGNDEATFVFAGTCANNEPYRLVSYQANISGSSRSFYDYDGPNGQGTVQAETSPKVMAARVCRKLAEIINANYWE